MEEKEFIVNFTVRKPVVPGKQPSKSLTISRSYDGKSKPGRTISAQAHAQSSSQENSNTIGNNIISSVASTHGASDSLKGSSNQANNEIIVAATAASKSTGGTQPNSSVGAAIRPKSKSGRNVSFSNTSAEIKSSALIHRSGDNSPDMDGVRDSKLDVDLTKVELVDFPIQEINTPVDNENTNYMFTYDLNGRKVSYQEYVAAMARRLISKSDSNESLVKSVETPVSSQFPVPAKLLVVRSLDNSLIKRPSSQNGRRSSYFLRQYKDPPVRGKSAGSASSRARSSMQTSPSDNKRNNNTSKISNINDQNNANIDSSQTSNTVTTANQDSSIPSREVETSIANEGSRIDHRQAIIEAEAIEEEPILIATVIKDGLLACSLPPPDPLIVKEDSLPTRVDPTEPERSNCNSTPDKNNNSKIKETAETKSEVENRITSKGEPGTKSVHFKAKENNENSPNRRNSLALKAKTPGDGVEAVEDHAKRGRSASPPQTGRSSSSRGSSRASNASKDRGKKVSQNEEKTSKLTIEELLEEKINLAYLQELGLYPNLEVVNDVLSTRKLAISALGENRVASAKRKAFKKSSLNSTTKANNSRDRKSQGKSKSLVQSSNEEDIMDDSFIRLSRELSGYSPEVSRGMTPIELGGFIKELAVYDGDNEDSSLVVRQRDPELHLKYLAYDNFESIGTEIEKNKFENQQKEGHSAHVHFSETPADSRSLAGAASDGNGGPRGGSTSMPSTARDYGAISAGLNGRRLELPNKTRGEQLNDEKEVRSEKPEVISFLDKSLVLQMQYQIRKYNEIKSVEDMIYFDKKEINNQLALDLKNIDLRSSDGSSNGYPQSNQNAEIRNIRSSNSNSRSNNGNFNGGNDIAMDQIDVRMKPHRASYNFRAFQRKQHHKNDNNKESTMSNDIGEFQEQFGAAKDMLTTIAPFQLLQKTSHNIHQPSEVESSTFQFMLPIAMSDELNEMEESAMSPSESLFASGVNKFSNTIHESSSHMTSNIQNLVKNLVNSNGSAPAYPGGKPAAQPEPRRIVHFGLSQVPPAPESTAALKPHGLTPFASHQQRTNQRPKSQQATRHSNS